MSDRHLPLAEAVRRHVRPGMSLHLAYGGGRPNAVIAEIVRAFAGTTPGFTVSAHGFVNSQHALLEAGLVERLIVAFAGENYPSPRPNPALNRALKNGVAIENWSIWTLTARLMAGALGLDHFPVRSLVGSGMAAEHEGTSFTTLQAFGGAPSGAVAPLRPDLVLVHGLAADEEGNILLPAPYGEGAWGALAAREGVIATVEAIVPSEVLRRRNSAPIIPAHAVRSVSLAPLGSHPYGLATGDLDEVAGYGEDEAFMAELRAAAKTPEDLAAWTRRWMLEPGDHDGFLAALGADRIAALRADDAAPVAPSTDPELTLDERMTLVAARVVRDRIARDGVDLVLSGIGYAHLAAWTAATRLQGEGVEVELAAELGMSGFRPQPGDPYLFARRNLPTSARLTDVMEVLARDVSGPGTRSLGVLGAGQVDQEGNLNSTWSGSGAFILGSGGANDVASGADDLIVVLRHSADRLVPAVDYVTAPGSAVSTIVTSEAVLERRDGRFVVTRVIGDDPASAIERVRAGVGWPVDIADDVEREPEPDAADVALLRSFDPRGVFLGSRA